jgi:hypothetical protein
VSFCSCAAGGFHPVPICAPVHQWLQHAAHTVFLCQVSILFSHLGAVSRPLLPCRFVRHRSSFGPVSSWAGSTSVVVLTAARSWESEILTLKSFRRPAAHFPRSVSPSSWFLHAGTCPFQLSCAPLRSAPWCRLRLTRIRLFRSLSPPSSNSSTFRLFLCRPVSLHFTSLI